MRLQALSLTLLFFAAFAAAVPNWPSAPDGCIVAVASLASPIKGKTSTGSGESTLFLAPPEKGNSTVITTLRGQLVNVTMAHIHMYDAANGNPVRVDLFPYTPTPAYFLIEPPFTYMGEVTFVTTFNTDRLAFWNRGNGNMGDFVSLLRNGMLFVNVHTITTPTEIAGTLECRPPCEFAPATGK